MTPRLPLSTRITQWVVASVAVLGLLASLYNGRQINEVHVLFNSRMTEFIELTQKSSKAEGVKEGREQQIPH